MSARENVISLDERRAETVKLHRVLSSLKVARVVKRFGKVELHLTDGRVINLGTSKYVLSFREAQAAIADVTGIVIKIPSGAKWEQVAQTIFDAVEVEDRFTYDADDEAREWVERYCAQKMLRACVDLSDKTELFDALERSPKGFRDEHGNAYVNLDYFMRFVGAQFNTRLTLREAVERLGRLGFESKQVAARQGEELRRRRLWMSPKGFFDNRDVEES